MCSSFTCNSFTGTISVGGSIGEKSMVAIGAGIQQTQISQPSVDFELLAKEIGRVIEIAQKESNETIKSELTKLRNVVDIKDEGKIREVINDRQSIFKDKVLPFIERICQSATSSALAELIKRMMF